MENCAYGSFHISKSDMMKKENNQLFFLYSKRWFVIQLNQITRKTPKTTSPIIFADDNLESHQGHLTDIKTTASK